MALDKAPERRIPLTLGDSRLLELLAQKLPEYMEQADIQVLLSELRNELYAGVGDSSARMLHSVTKNCHRCTGMNEPNLPYWNVADPDLVIVAESPLSSQQAQDTLVGALKSAGFSSTRLCLTYINRCKPKEYRKHSADEIKNCLPYLHTEIQILKPKLIVTLGYLPSAVMFGKDIQVNEVRGKIHWLGHWALLPVYTPAYVLNGPDHLADTFAADLKLAHEFIYGNN